MKPKNDAALYARPFQVHNAPVNTNSAINPIKKLAAWKDPCAESLVIARGDDADSRPFTAEALLSELDSTVDFLYIDIGGIETEVLLKCESRLINVKSVQIRYYSSADKPEMLPVLLELLARNGFRYHLTPIDPPDHPFIKKEREAKIYMGASARLDIRGTRQGNAEIHT